MGNSQSLFYPDNPNRRDRAQQLANDCQNFVDQYNTKHQTLEDDLGVYKDKVMQVLAAFGCDTLDDFDKVVQENATGQALQDWNDVKGEYDRAQVVDQVIMGAMGVIAIAGLAISSVGALAGGFGFFAGIAVTSDILITIAVFGAIFDAIEGAVIRSKLRDSINKLFTDRIKCKKVLNGIDNLTTWVPTIRVLYQSFEQTGYNKEAIIELLKTNGIAKPVQEDMTAETYYKAAQELHDMDVGRNSWTNEDPSWESTAGSLDFDDLLHGLTGILDHGLLSQATSVAATSRSISRRPEANTDLNTDTDVDSEIILPPPPPYEKNIRVAFSAGSRMPALRQPLHLILHSFVDNTSANVYIHTDDGRLLGIDGNKTVVETIKNKVQWNVSFANESDTSLYGPHADSNIQGVELDILISSQGSFIANSGILSSDRGEAAVFHARYLRA